MAQVQGHITDPESSDPVVGVEFNPDRNVAELYIDEGATQTEVSLTREQLRQLAGMMSRVESQMEWHAATWIYASGNLASDTHHLMRKGEHDKRGKTLCGQEPHRYPVYNNEWRLAPVIGEPWRTGSVCKRCLTIYDKRKSERN